MDFLLCQRRELKNLAAAHERRIHRKKRILRRGSDQNDQSRFNIREQNILLRAIKAMDFIEKKRRALTAMGKPFLGGVENRPDFLDANRRGVYLFKMTLGVIGD